MHRAPFILVTGIAVAAAWLLSSVQAPSGAGSGSPPPGGQGFVGSWRVTFDTPTGPSGSLLTIMADGTLLFSGRPVSPAAGGFPVIFSSSGHGAWQAAGDTAAAMTWVGLVTDGEGSLLAVVTDSVEATLAADESAWSGTYSASIEDPEGTVLYEGGATVQAARITVQPLATAAPGTPVAG